MQSFLVASTRSTCTSFNSSLRMARMGGTAGSMEAWVEACRLAIRFLKSWSLMEPSMLLLVVDMLMQMGC